MILFKFYSNLQTLTYRPGSTSRLTVRLENKYDAISALKHANKLYEHKKNTSYHNDDQRLRRVNE